MKSTRIIVSATPKNLSSAVTELKKHGMNVESVLETTGIVTGEIDAAKVSALKKIPGITVELEDTVQIPPPDAEIQ